MGKMKYNKKSRSRRDEDLILARLFDTWLLEVISRYILIRRILFFLKTFKGCYHLLQVRE
jgi:hypothetical protein